MRFETEPELVKVLPAWAASAAPINQVKLRNVAASLHRQMNNILRTGVIPKNLKSLGDYLQNLVFHHKAIAARGIVVAGKIQIEVRIFNNTVEQVQQGIHVALSHHLAPRDVRDVIGRAVISNNTVSVKATQAATGQVNGISIGNITNLVVLDNQICIDSSPRLAVYGVQVIGTIGPLLIIRQNFIQGSPTGIFIRALPGSSTKNLLWIAADNLAMNAVKALDGPPLIRNTSVS
jgi:hypothetical protein